MTGNQNIATPIVDYPLFSNANVSPFSPNNIVVIEITFCKYKCVTRLIVRETH